MWRAVRIPRCFLVMVVVFLAGGLLPAASVQLYQMDFNLDGNIYTDTEWGAVDLPFMGSHGAEYFNLAVNGQWVVENMPVLSVMGPDVPNTLRYYFDLGVPRGTSVSTVTYDYAVTSAALAAMPGGAVIGNVFKDSYEFFNGLLYNPISGVLPAAKKLIGGIIDRFHVHWGFPHLEQGENECTPTAVLQSLLWLKDKKGLAIPDSALNIDWVKANIGWTEDGCGENWADLKDKATGGWGVKTAVLDFRTATPTQRREFMERLGREMDDDQDIELDITGHTTTLVGLVRLTNGKYVVATVDDKNQGKDGGRVIALDIYDPADSSLWNIPLIGGGFGNSVLERAVIECPEPATFVIMALAGVFLMRRRR